MLNFITQAKKHFYSCLYWQFTWKLRWNKYWNMLCSRWSRLMWSDAQTYFYFFLYICLPRFIFFVRFIILYFFCVQTRMLLFPVYLNPMFYSLFILLCSSTSALPLVLPPSVIDSVSQSQLTVCLTCQRFVILRWVNQWKVCLRRRELAEGEPLASEGTHTQKQG